MIELLEEEGIPIDMVIGTSAGAIVGGLYCSGYTPEQIKDNLYLFSNNAPLKNTSYSPFEQILGSHGTDSAPLALSFAEKDQSFSLGFGNGLLNGQNVYEMLKKLTIKIPSDKNFDSLPIPFRAVATNLINGTVAVFSSGDIADSIRSSMSIPGIFKPYEIDGNYYIDGLALDNEPVDVAIKMGYDIIIVSAFSDTMEDNPASFDANPLVAVSQMMNMEQSSHIQNNRQFVDLIIYPDFAEESVLAYSNAEGIYTAAKKSMDKYRTSCQELHDKIYPAKNEPKAQYAAPYESSSYLTVDSLSIVNADAADEKFIRKLFLKVKGKPFTEASYKMLEQNIFHIGKYSTITMRITGQEESRTLTVELHPQKKESGLFLLGANLDTSIANDSHCTFTISSDFQLRGFNGYGSLISAKTTFLNGVDTEFLYTQPIGPIVFSQLTAKYYSKTYTSRSGWSYQPTETLANQGAYADLKFCFSLTSTRQILAADAGIRWLNTTDVLSDGINSMCGDFSAEYLLNTLDYPCFPNSGTYLSIKGTGILPIDEHDVVPIGDRTQIDFVEAVPFSNDVNGIINAYAGMAISEQLKKLPGYYPVYGFSLADRRFFPQISSYAPWGLHKFALGASLQYEPGSTLSVFGLNIILSISGAVGNLFADYESINLKGLKWSASLNAGIRIHNSYGILVRLGAGTTCNTVRPFLSADFGSIRF